MTHPITTSFESGVIPVAIGLEQINEAIKVLNRLRTHPGDGTLVGFLPEQIASLDVVLARIDRKQKDWIDRNLIEVTEAEAATTNAALLRMAPAVAKARKNSLFAEDLRQMLKGEIDSKVALERFLTQAGQPISVRDQKNILALPNAVLLPKKYAARQAYTLTVAVESTDRTASTVRFLLVDKVLPDPMFSENDSGTRTILTCADDTADIKLLALCMANNVTVQVKVALSLNISGSGLAYTANLIKILDPASALASVNQAMAEDKQGLF